MNTISSPAVSGVLAASTRLDAAAHNLANAQTPAFRRDVVSQQSQEGSGVLTTVGRADEIGADLEADLIAQKQAAYTYVANLKSIRTQDELMGSLLDIQA
jgi:flagellar hook protein FlgE